VKTRLAIFWQWLKKSLGNFRYFTRIRLKKLPRFYRHFTRVEKRAAIIAGILILLGSGFFLWDNCIGTFREVPARYGTYTEGFLGRPQLVHPLFAQTDVDRDLARLLFSGLLRVDENGKYVGDLAEKWNVSEDKLVYLATLKKDLKWSDGKALTIDDALFTYQTMQDSWYMGSFSGVFKNVLIEKSAERQIKFTLKAPSPSFWENLTIGLIPQNIFKNKKPAEFVKLAQTWKAVGSGPFILKNIALKAGQPVLADLQSNPFYAGSKPYLSKIVLRFYDNSLDLAKAFENREIAGFSAINPTNLEKLSQLQKLNIYRVPLPQYTGIFFNLGKEYFADKNVRQALAFAVDKESVVEKALYGQGRAVSSVVLPETLGFKTVKDYKFNPNKARDMLIEAGWQMGTNKILVKDQKPFALNLTYLDNDLSKKIAKLLQADWKTAGLEVKLVPVSLAELQSKILPERDFDVLLFGENLGALPDYSTFWHSSQVASGFNLSGLEDGDTDFLLEEISASTDTNDKIDKLGQFQDYVAENVPAVFLFQPYFLYAIDASIKGIVLDKMYISSDRFASVTSWYIKTKREKVPAPVAVKKAEATKTPTVKPTVKK